MKLRGGIIGSGVFGGYHARKYAEHPDTNLIAIYDIELVKAKVLADQYDAHAYDDLNTFLAHIDVVTIASPASTHAQNAKAAQIAKKSVLVEKPLATNLGDADALIMLAQQHGLVLAVGHQERLVFAAIGLFDLPELPLHIEANRLGPWSERGSDVSVTLDLLIHDADLVLSLFGQPKVWNTKAIAKTVHTVFPDNIKAELSLSSGGTAKLRASRISKERIRNMRIEYPSGNIEIDFINRTFKNSTPFKLDENFQDTAAGKDPLGANFDRFIQAVMGKAERPAVTGDEGYAALKLALSIDAAAGF